MNQTFQPKRTMTRILLAFMLILTGYAGVFAQESSSNAGNCSIYSVNNLFPSNTQAKTNVFAWTVKLEGDPSGNGLSHFNLVNTNQSKTCASDVASLIKQAWYSTDANPGPVGGPKWSTTSVVIGDGSTDNCLPNGTADRPYVIKFSVTAPFIHYALEFKSKYPVSTGVAVPKYGRNCCSTPIQFPNFCDPSPVCIDPVFTVSKTDLTCFGSANGSISVTGVTGGLSPYTYSLNGSAYTGNTSFSGLSAGTYTVRVKESEGGCTTEQQVVLIQPTALVASNEKVDVKCYGESTGSVDASVTGGTGSYTYSWSNGSSVVSTSQDLSNVAAGTYTLTVTDANNCTTTTVAVIGQPNTVLAASVIETKGTECAGTKTGSITLSVSGGTAPYKYTLNGGNPTDLPGDGIIASLQAGNYTVYVQDANGCNVTIQGNVTVAEGPVCYPYYTYSQGYYGNTNGMGVACIRGEDTWRTRDFIKKSLKNGGGMILGSTNNTSPNTGRTLKALLTNGVALDAVLNNILKVMPGGGSPNFLTGSLDITTTVPSSSPLLKNGKFNNVLLGQTVAMWLNVNIPGNELGSLDLIGLKCKTTIVTKEASSASSCKTPYAGTTEVSTTFPQSVVNAMIKRGKTTVKDLVDFASEMLGASGKVYTIGSGSDVVSVSLSDMNSALDAIVNAFHGGKYFARFDGSIGTCTLLNSKLNVASPVEDATAVKVENSNAVVVVKAFPNPYIDQVTFNVTVKNAGKGSLVIYNMLGQKVTNLFEGNMQANSTQTIRYNVPFAQRKNLVYVFRQNDITNTGKLVSGK